MEKGTNENTKLKKKVEKKEIILVQKKPSLLPCILMNAPSVHLNKRKTIVSA